jgi:CRP/FNR family transcriptional regulator, dissimilatory nitrate respiration regulator
MPASDETLTRLLRATPFGGLEDTERAGVSRLFVRQHVRKGGVVFLEGDEADRFFLVAAGKLKAFRHVPPTHDITMFTLERGDFVGFVPLLDGRPYPVSVSALTPAELLVLYRSEFLDFTRDNASFCLSLLAHLARRLRECMDQVETLGRQGAVARAAHGLLSLVPPARSHDAPAEVTLPFTQTELAQVLHVTPENLSRALARLRRLGLIQRVGPRRFRIPHLDGLRKIANPE